jgi:predicted permease
MMGSFIQELRQSTRALWKNPGFTFIAVLTLALGIGANTAIFSLVNSVLLRPLPVQDSSQIAVLGFTRGHGEIETHLSFPALEDLRHQPDSPFTDLIGYQFGSDGLDVDGKAYALFTNYVTGNYFEVLGLKPALGRLIYPTEGMVPGADPVIVISYSLWKARFGGDPNLIGRKVLLDARPFTVIGVAPEGFHGLQPIIDTRAYIPLAMHVSLNSAYRGDEKRNALTDRNIQALNIVGRLRPGVTAKQAEIAVIPAAKQVSLQAPEAEKDLTIQVVPELQARPDIGSYNSVFAVSGLFLALAAFVLVLACMNVANILLVRATLRRREMAIRAALGGTRARLVRLLLIESVLLALLGGLGGVLLGNWLSGYIGSINLRTTLPIILDFSFDWRVFSYGLAAALLTGILVGIVPAIRASRSNLMEVLNASGRTVVAGRQRFRSALVIAQVAGSLVLLIMAGLFTRSLGMARKVNLGFDPNRVTNVTFDVRGIGYSEEQGQQFSTRLLERIRSLPGAESAAIAFTVPFGYYSDAETLQIDGYTPPSKATTPFAGTSAISPSYFQTMRIPLLRGRDIADTDLAKTEAVAIVNQAMAKMFWPKQDPLGRQFELKSHPDEKIRIVGVVKDSRRDNFDGDVSPFFYTALAQGATPLQTLHVRTFGPPENIIPVVEQEIEKLAPGLPLIDVGTMLQGLNTLNGLLLFELGAGIAAALGLLGLVLAVLGVYGIVSYVTSQRTHEIGVRMALGAEPSRILKMVLRQGLFIVVVGLVIGILAAGAAGYLAASFLVGVHPTDPITFFGVSMVLALITLIACYIPARRATKVDPMVALRYE